MRIWINEYNITNHRTTKMKPVDVKNNTNVDRNKEVNDKDPKFKNGDHVRISKYKIIFAKGYTSNWSEDVFVIKKVKNTIPWTYVINDSMVKKLLKHFMKKNYRKLINKGLSKSRKKVINMSNGKVAIVHLKAVLLKKT